MSIKVLIVVRQSPDWLQITPSEFDVQFATFCKMIGRESVLLLELIRLWDQTFDKTYFQVRQKMKEISEDNLHTLSNIILVSNEQRKNGRPAENSIICFIDDDDWFHPKIGELLLTNYELSLDGYLWQHLACGRFTGNGLHYRSELNYCFTNNYAVTTKLIEEVGWQNLEQHWLANNYLETKNFKRLSKYLSMTNKHPAATVMLETLGASNLKSSDLIDFVNTYVHRTKAALDESKSEASWALPYIGEVLEFFSQLKPI